MHQDVLVTGYEVRLKPLGTLVTIKKAIRQHLTVAVIIFQYFWVISAVLLAAEQGPWYSNAGQRSMQIYILTPFR
jgi:hypothetical protein